MQTIVRQVSIIVILFSSIMQIITLRAIDWYIDRSVPQIT